MSGCFFDDPNSFSHQFYELGIESLQHLLSKSYSQPSPSVSVSMTNIISSSSSLTDFSLDMQATPMENKSKSRKGSSINLVSTHSKSVQESDKGKRKRERKNGDGVVKEKEDSSDSERKKKIIIEEKMKDEDVGYIHVRARRGQATDTHSLAERVRREKISERMKILQGLVPGCDKVTGKALILDEIINYVQSLQNQVEFLSMKLASENPMLYDGDLDILHAPNTDIKMQQWNPTMSSGAVAKSDLTMPTTLPISDYQFIATPTSSLRFQHPHFLIPINQGNGQLLWDTEDQRTKIH